MAKAVNIEKLTSAARTYAPAYTALTYHTFSEVAAKLGIRVVNVDGEHVLVNRRHKAGILAPYKIGLPETQAAEVMKFVEMKLKPELTYADVRDNVTAYDNIEIIADGVSPSVMDNKTKKHPYEMLLISGIVTSFGEDVIASMFFAERDPNTKSPLTAFNGFGMKRDALVAAGLISASEGNLTTTGAFEAPTSSTDSTAYDKLVSFIASADPMLRAREAHLKITEDALLKVRAGYKNKVRAFSDPTLAEVIERLKDDANCPHLVVQSHVALGRGSGLYLTAPGMFDFGVGKQDDQEFVQVRSFGADPNDVQFWIQASYDTRFNDVHRKVFHTNEQKNTGMELAGDYR